MRILLVDDEVDVLDTFKQRLENVFNDMAVDTAENTEQAIALLKKAREENVTYDCCVTDLRMSNNDDEGLRVVEEAVKIAPNMPTVVLTGFEPDENRIRKTMELGGFSFCRKGGGEEFEVLVGTIRRAAEFGQMKMENEQLLSQLEEQLGTAAKSNGTAEIRRITGEMETAVRSLADMLEGLRAAV